MGSVICSKGPGLSPPTQLGDGASPAVCHLPRFSNKIRLSYKSPNWCRHIPDHRPDPPSTRTKASAEKIKKKIKPARPHRDDPFHPRSRVSTGSAVGYAWQSARNIVLFVCAGILLLSLIGVQGWKQENATGPPRIIIQRSVASGFFYAFCIGSAMMNLVYFVAIWFQAVEDITEYESGIRMLPLV